MFETYFYHTTLPLSEGNRISFEGCHRETFLNNKLSIISNKANTECLIKCCGELPLLTSFTLLGTYTVEQAKELLKTTEWKRVLT